MFGNEPLIRSDASLARREPGQNPSSKSAKLGAQRPTRPTARQPSHHANVESAGSNATAPQGGRDASATAREGNAGRLPGLPLAERVARSAAALASARCLAGIPCRFLRVAAQLALSVKGFTDFQ